MAGDTLLEKLASLPEGHSAAQEMETSERGWVWENIAA